eukprot:4939626-Amphidinium_carterae.2
MTVPGMCGKNPLRPWPKLKKIADIVILLAVFGMVPSCCVAVASVGGHAHHVTCNVNELNTRTC